MLPPDPRPRRFAVIGSTLSLLGASVALVVSVQQWIAEGGLSAEPPVGDMRKIAYAGMAGAMVGGAAGKSPFDPIERGVVTRVPQRGNQGNHRQQPERIHRRQTAQPNEGRRNQEQTAEFEQKHLPSAIKRGS